MSLPPQTQTGLQNRDSFLNIASDLSNLSRMLNMPEPKVLGERSVNVPTGGPAQNEKPNEGKKRKSDSNEAAIHPDDIDLDSNFEITWTANQVRSKIRQYINSGEMKVGEFQRALGITAGSYSHFMGQNGPDKGTESSTFLAAAVFFKRRELAGISMPKKKVKTSGTSSTDTSNTDAAQAKAKAKARNDVSGIHLDGEDTDNVPVYDTCDDIRAKIGRHMRDTPGASNAGFIRDVNGALGAGSSLKASTHQLTTFLNSRGSNRGAESPVFYASYVFFEKLRIKHGKPKGKKREEMEREWGRQGMHLRDTTRSPIWASAGSKPYVDQYGKIRSLGR